LNPGGVEPEFQHHVPEERDEVWVGLLEQFQLAPAQQGLYMVLSGHQCIRWVTSATLAISARSRSVMALARSRLAARAFSSSPRALSAAGEQVMPLSFRNRAATARSAAAESAAFTRSVRALARASCSLPRVSSDAAIVTPS